MSASKTSSKGAASSAFGETEIARVQTYLRGLFGNPSVAIETPRKAGQSAEVAIGGEFVGTLHRDVEDGEVSYALHVVILAEDLPSPQAPAKAPAASKR